MKNKLLTSLPNGALQALQPDLEELELKRGDIIYRADHPVEHVYFPHSGLVSLVVTMNSGETAETSIAGREGLVCSAIVLDVQDAIDQATVEIDGVATRIAALPFLIAYRSHEALRIIVNRHHAMFIAEGRQSTACNAIHKVDKRLCRWLANARDQVGLDRLALTHEFMGRMLGVQRTTVTDIYKTLQEHEIVEIGRGHVTILQPDALIERACECYGILRRRFNHVFNAKRSSR